MMVYAAAFQKLYNVFDWRQIIIYEFKEIQNKRSNKYPPMLSQNNNTRVVYNFLCGL